MASSTITKPAKQLGELLKQQQEPFVLDLYLIERGYVKKGLTFNSESGFRCCNGNSNKSSKKGILRCSRILRTIFKKFARNNDRKNNKTCEGKFSFNGQEAAEPDWLSSSSTTVYNSCSESDKDESSTNSTAAETWEALRLSNMTEEEAFAGREFQFKFTGNTKQHSPVSVLERLPSSRLDDRTRQDQENEATCTVILPKKLITGHSDSFFSASLREVLHFHSDSHRPIRKSSNGNSDNSIELKRFNDTSPQFPKSKTMLQQTRQLLFDCMKEIVQSHAKEEKVKKCHLGFLGPKELGNLLWEKMKVWGKKVGDETNKITYLLGLDFFESAQEWSASDQETREISAEIGDSIAEEIVNEIVAELSNYDFLAPVTC